MSTSNNQIVHSSEDPQQISTYLGLLVVKGFGKESDFKILREIPQDERTEMLRDASTLSRTATLINKNNLKLTPREAQVLANLERGLANKEIAIALNVSESAIKFHVSALLRKFGVSSRVDLAICGAKTRYMLNFRTGSK